MGKRELRTGATLEAERAWRAQNSEKVSEYRRQYRERNRESINERQNARRVPKFHVDEDGRECSVCGDYLVWSAFSRYARSSTGYKSACKKCLNRAEQERVSTPEKTEQERARKRESKYLTRFGLTLVQLDELHASVGYRCEACGTHRDDTQNRALVLDHDHSCCPTEKTCGKCISGVLCTACNVALGALRDDPLRVARLAEYAERTRRGETDH